ncbi:MAG: substrate-binding domain-containing protein [Myxococcales bacterium]|nr:substrate-binding domain-containing protein [Myxococcales bacterium]
MVLLSKLFPQQRSRFFWWVFLLAILPQTIFFSWLWKTPPAAPKQSKQANHPRPPSPPPLHKNLHIAGSGSCLPLMRHLQRQIKSPFVLHPSIGSTGGMRALRDHAIQLALLSRPPKPREKTPTLRFLHYADVPVVFAVHPSVPIRDISPQQMMELYQGRMRRWSNGLPVVVFQREQGDSGHQAIYEHYPLFQKVNEQAYQQQRWRVLYHDREMQDMLNQTPGSIGIFDLGAILLQRLSLRALSFRGVPPTLAAYRAKRYPFSKPLLLAYHTPPHPPILRLLQQITQPDITLSLQKYGYQRLGQKP